MTTPVPHDPQKLAYRIDEAVKASGLGRSFLYERIADGSLKSVKIGGRRLILKNELVAFLSREAVKNYSLRQLETKPAGGPQRGQLELPLK